MPDYLRALALPLKELREITGQERFVSEEPIPSTEDAALALTAISVWHLGASGFYKAVFPHRSLLIYVAYLRIH